MAKLSPDNHLSGSVVPAWLGHSPYQTAYDVLEKARNAVAGIEPAPLDSLQADIGTAIEPVILRRGLEMLGLDPEAMTNYEQDGQLAAKKHPDMELYYSDDGLFHMKQPMKITGDADVHVMGSEEMLIEGTIVLEAKYTTANEKPSDPPLFRGPLQLQAGMMCHDAKYGILFTCYAGRKIVAHVFERHQATVDKITAAVREFEQHMADRTWPEPQTVDELVSYYSEPAEDPIDLDDDLIESVLSIDDANQAIKQQQEMKDVHGQRLMAAMGNHTKAAVTDSRTGLSYNVTWPFRKTKAKPAECCPACNHELKAAVPESEARQKTVTVKRNK